jgi:hypothetical protein
MPVTDDSMPEPLREALGTMEASMQSFKTALAYQAPEMHRELWIGIQHDLADAFVELHNKVSPEPYEPSEVSNG